jgi:hypothetical protein
MRWHRVEHAAPHQGTAASGASIGDYETEVNIKEQQRPTQEEDKRSSVSSKRKWMRQRKSTSEAKQREE